MVVKRVLKAEGVGHRQLPVFRKALQRSSGLPGPAATAGQHQRPLGSEQQVAQLPQGIRIGPALHRLQARQRLGVHHFRQHVFGQHQHHRTGPAVHSGGKGARHVLGDAPRVVDALHPLGHALGARAKKHRVVDLLKGLAVARIARHIAHEQHHGRGVLEGGVQADGCIGRARPSGHETHARATGQLALSLGHEGRAALLPIGDEADAVALGVKTVEHGEVTLTRHAKGMCHPLSNQTFDKQVASNSCGHTGVQFQGGDSVACEGRLRQQKQIDGWFQSDSHQPRKKGSAVSRGALILFTVSTAGGAGAEPQAPAISWPALQA